MNKNYIFGNVNEALPPLMTHLLADGDEVGSRLGERTLEMTHVGITLEKPWQREIVLPERKASIAAQIAETMWVLSGRTDIEWLSNYLPRAVDFSDNGTTWRAGYGARLRNYGGVDQIDYIVNLLQKSPGSRQAVATIWDPVVDSTPGKDIACNNWLHFLARKGRLDLMVGIRSNDSMWGWSGINAFEWSALQEIVAGMIGHEVGALHFAVGSFHLYDRHWEKARRLSRVEGNFRYSDSPRFNATGMDDMSSFDYCAEEWFRLEEHIRSGKDVSLEVEQFPEPMLQSWLRVLQWWWTGEHFFLENLRNTRLYEACKIGVQPKRDALVVDTAERPAPGFTEMVNALHTEKHLAYGDSWKRRGEYMIMANIARKIDRLEGGADTPDETQTDTAIDLMVYLAKYEAWLSDKAGDPDDVAVTLAALESMHGPGPMPSNAVETLVADFARLEQATGLREKINILDPMLRVAYALAHSRWSK